MWKPTMYLNFYYQFDKYMLLGCQRKDSSWIVITVLTPAMTADLETLLICKSNRDTLRTLGSLSIMNTKEQRSYVV